MFQRSRMIGAAAMTAAALLAAGCTIGGNGGGSDGPPPPPPAAISVPDAAGPPVNPLTPIAVKVDGGTLTSVAVTNPAENDKAVTGTFAPNHLSWTSNVDLGYASTYHVVATAANTAGKPTTKTFDVKTIAPQKTAYANVVPAPNLVADGGIGVGQPMVFQFTEPVKNKAEVQKHLSITTDPPQPGAWYWVDDKDVHYRPPTYWKPGTKIHIEAHVYGLDLGNGIYGAEDNSADYTVHDSWVAKADGSTETLTVFHNGEQVNQMPMSLGSPGHPSHEGPHVVSAKMPSIVMDSCSYGVCQGDPGYYKETVYKDLRISNDGEFVHSAPWSVGQQGASNVSHGCVNLSPENAQWMYDHFNIGDVVEITNSGGPPLPVWDTYGDWEMPWSQWQAGDASS